MMSESETGLGVDVVLACERKPPSTNNDVGKGREDFGHEIALRYREAGEPKLTGLLYGVVIWFVRGYRPGNEPDADNISKGIWDMLSAPKQNDAPGRQRLGAFNDDKQVRLRTAGIFDLAPAEGDAPSLEQLDLTDVPPNVVQRLRDMVGGITDCRSLTYIRFGTLRGGMYELAPLGRLP